MKQQSQWVGIFLGLIVVISLIVVYMYRKSNYEVTPYVPQSAPPTPVSNVVATTSNVVATSNVVEVLPPLPKVAELPPDQAAATDIEPAYAFEKYATYSDTANMAPAPIESSIVPTPKVSTYAPMPTDLFEAARDTTDAFQEIDFQVSDKYGRETSGDASQAS
jgi:hypothetical protein